MKKLLLCLFVLSMFQAKAQKTYFYTGAGAAKEDTPITLCSLDILEGKLELNAIFHETDYSSYICFSPKRDFIYAINRKGDQASVSSLKIDKESKLLQLIDTEPLEGKGTCHISVSSDNQFILVANYGSGSVEILPINEDGSLEPTSNLKQHEGSGPNEKRQKDPHAHYIQTSPDDKFVFAVDLGIDKVMNYVLDKKDGLLLTNPNQAFLPTAAGTGPRHLVFGQNGKYVYILNELASSVSVCKYDAQTGILELLKTHPMLPKDFTEFSKAAAIRIHPSGKFLYASNRGHDSIAVFKIKGNGDLKRIQIIQEGITWPRDFNIDPTGLYLLSANTKENEVRAFKIEKNGTLIKTEHTVTITEPMCIIF